MKLSIFRNLSKVAGAWPRHGREEQLSVHHDVIVDLLKNATVGHPSQSRSFLEICDFCDILLGILLFLMYHRTYDAVCLVNTSYFLAVHYFSPLGKPADRAIYFACVNFFLFLN